MSEGHNRVTLFGGLVQDPKLRFTQAGTAILTLRMVTTEVYFDRDKQKKEDRQFHSVFLMGSRAEALSKFLRKGREVLVEGSLSTKTYDGRDGIKRYKTEVKAKNIIITSDGGGRRERQTDPPQPRRSPPGQRTLGGVLEGELPDAFGPADDDEEAPF